MSQVEKDNILTIKRAEVLYKAEHPYPKEYMAGNMVEEDLDGDGRPEQLQYIFEELEYHTYTGRIIINGQEFIVEDYQDVWLDNPRLTFYVTDILPQYKGLEIAIMDNGPSEDPVTYFFTYKDGVLTNIGGVGGYPFKKECGYNGFANKGAVVGEIVMGFTHTCWGFGTWRYNYEEQELEYLDTGYYINKYDYFHINFMKILQFTCKWMKVL